MSEKSTERHCNYWNEEVLVSVLISLWIFLAVILLILACVPGGTASACSGSSVANISRAHSDGNLSSAAERIRDSKVRIMNVWKIVPIITNKVLLLMCSKNDHSIFISEKKQGKVLRVTHITSASFLNFKEDRLPINLPQLYTKYVCENYSHPVVH